jgi:ABC-type transport system substrate-binding protein
VTNKATGWDNTRSTEVVDKYTFRININQYNNTWLRYPAGYLQISPTAYNKDKAYLDWHPVGTGAWKFVSYKENQEVNYERFNDYWGQKTYPDTLKVIIIPDKVTAQLSFQAGIADCMWIVGGSVQMAQQLAAKGFVITSSPGQLRSMIPSSGLTGSPYANLKVRQAVEYAIDKVKICKEIGLSMWTPSYQDIMTYHGAYDPNFPGRTYDPAKAKQLLTEAGYPSGFKTVVWEATQLTGDHLPAIQANLKAVNIDADAQIFSTAKWADVEINGLPEGLDISNHNGAFGFYLHRYFGQPTIKSTDPYYWTSVYRPDELNKMVNDFQVIPDNDLPQLVSKGKTVEKYIFDNAITIPLWEVGEAYYALPTCHDDGLAKWGKLVQPGFWGYNEVWLDK